MKQFIEIIMESVIIAIILKIGLEIVFPPYDKNKDTK